MNLQEHLALVGHSPGLFAFSAKVPVEVINRALAGQPIAQVHAEQITKTLSNLHGMHHQQGIKPEHIEGLSIVPHGVLKKKSSAS